MFADDENVKGTTNALYCFSITVVVKNIIIKISNRLKYRA